MIATICLLILQSTDPNDPNQLIRVESSSRAQTLRLIHDAGLDPLEIEWDGDAALLPSYEEAKRLLVERGAKVTVQVPNLKQHFEQEQNQAPQQAMALQGPPLGFGSMGGYYTYQEIGEKLDELQFLFPNVISGKISIGQSLEGRDIWAVRISNNPEIDQNKPRAFFDAMHHAREPQGMMSLFHFMFHLGSSYGVDPGLTQLIDQREIWIVPIVNPDGYVYNQNQAPNGGGMWRKNRRPPLSGSTCWGVDLNRNYSTGWGVLPGSSGSTCSETYRGTTPFSEPETTALSNFYLSKTPFGAGNSIHTYGYLHMYPWGYQSSPPALQAAFELIGKWQAALHHYAVGPTYSTIYPASGVTVDWTHAALGAMSFTSEIGASFWPNQSLILPLAVENLESFTRIVATAGPYVQAISSQVAEWEGDGNGFINLKEKGTLLLSLQNYGSQASGKLEISIACADPNLILLSPIAQFESLAAFSAFDVTAGSLNFQVKKTALPGSVIPITVTITHDDFSFQEIVPVLIGTPEVIVQDDFEHDSGWTVGAIGDNAPAQSIWAKAAPAPYEVSRGTGYGGEMLLYLAQPGSDTSEPGSLAWITGGASATTSGNLNGQSTLKSPRYNLLGAWNPRLRFSRFFSSYNTNVPHFLNFVSMEDNVELAISPDDGQTWIEAMSYTPELNPGWKTESISLLELFAPMGIEPGPNTLFHFIAEDNGAGSNTEAALDDFRLESYPPAINGYVDRVDLSLQLHPQNNISASPSTTEFDLVIGQNGPDEAQKVTLLLKLPIGLEISQTGTGIPHEISSGLVQIELGMLDAGSTKRVPFAVHARHQGLYHLQAEIVFQSEFPPFGTAIDTNPANNRIRWTLNLP